jgi:hypothetical protein
VELHSLLLHAVKGDLGPNTSGRRGRARNRTSHLSFALLHGAAAVRVHFVPAEE